MNALASVSTTMGLTSSARRPSASAACMAMETRLPLRSTEPVIRLMVPLLLTWIAAEDIWPLLNRWATEMPRPGAGLDPGQGRGRPAAWCNGDGPAWPLPAPGTRCVGTSTPLAIRSPCWTAFFSRSLQGVQAQLLGQLVDGALHGEGGLGLAGRPVRLHLRLVDHHVEAVHQQVIDLVGPQAGQGAATHRRSRERPRFIGQVELGGGDAATAGRADFAAQQVADAGPLPSNTSLRVMVILTGRPLFLESTVTTGSRYEVPLAPAAADLEWDDLDLGLRHA